MLLIVGPKRSGKGTLARVPVDVLYDAWKGWCETEGRQAVTTRQSFGRDLAAAVVSPSVPAGEIERFVVEQTEATIERLSRELASHQEDAA